MTYALVSRTSYFALSKQPVMARAIHHSQACAKATEHRQAYDILGRDGRAREVNLARTVPRSVYPQASNCIVSPGKDGAESQCKAGS